MADMDFVSKMEELKRNITPESYDKSDTDIKVLLSIDQTLKDILKNGPSMSQSDVKNAAGDKSAFQRSYEQATAAKGKKKKAPGSFSDGIEEAVLESFLGSDFKEKIGGALDEFANLIGVDLKDVPGTLGKELGKQAMSAVKGTKFGQSVTGKFDAWKNKSIENVKSAYKGGVDKYDAAHPEEAAARKARQAAAKKPATSVPSGSTQGSSKISTEEAVNASKGPASNVGDVVMDAAAPVLTDAVTTMVSGAGGAGAALSGLTAAIGPLLSAIWPVIAAMVALELITEALGPAIEGTKKLFSAMGKAGNRYNESREKNLKLANERMEADIKSMVEAPFTILKDAAQKVYDAWDSNLRLINGTQGYNKSDLQDLMSSFSQRLRDEKLTKVVSGTDITESLSQVLKSGLSGKVAEEFAYQATKLNAAVPTQDFFGYADTYASLAANAIKAGQSEQQAMEYATNQMKLFASNVLYASRQLAGGFTTGLKDAQDLFDKSVQIAQASKFGDPAKIAGVLTSVAAITGSIAPDLTSSMTDAIVKAATGGNSSELVALRSLAGVNASNTEFLQAFAKDPQKVFADLFSELAKRQNMSENNYMEVAEGLSNVFGISMDAFSRIDFNYLAKAITNMNVSTASLDENMKHLASGETTTSAEQLRMQRINQYMIDEGLAYVLDNEVARSIQEHMWDEQMQRELMEATYAVELKGAALEFLEGIRQTIDNIIGFLMPWTLLKKVVNLAGTAAEAKAQDDDIRKLLELGKVGNGNAKALTQLTTRNANLNLSPDIIGLMGGVSSYGITSGLRNMYGSMWDPMNSYMDMLGPINSAAKSLLQFGATGGFGGHGVNSKYSWGTLGKSDAAAFAGSGVSQGVMLTGNQSGVSNSELARNALETKFKQLSDKDYINDEIKKNKGQYSYDMWKQSASSFGIADVDKAMEDLGYSKSQMENYIQSLQTVAAGQDQVDRLNREYTWWQIVEDQGVRMIEQGDERIEQNYTMITNQEFMITNQETLIQQGVDLNKLLTDVTNKHLDTISKDLRKFYDDWAMYVMDHEVYNKAYSSSDVEKIQASEKNESSTAIYALADALTKNTVDLLDPTVQTNALLSQILLVAQAIMQQNNKSGQVSIPDALSAMATGMFNPSSI